ncbi:MAG: tRNA-uridine aminocarboxypropyltransferase [Opitutaceae bacterium]|nr:tRNA-uridine aminocarboxypropyltransferase [Opitutaceae bacterium]
MRPTCYRCFWPADLCWCKRIQPIDTETEFVLLMHPKEFKQEKAATGRLTHLCLKRSRIVVGVSFEDDPEVKALLADPSRLTLLLYPGAGAINLSERSLAPEDLAGRRLTILVLDATWALARKMLRLSPTLRHLPRVMFTATHASRYVIKQQPQEGCLSTLEAVHETLLALEKSGLDTYTQPTQLLELFQHMQDYQIACASDPTRPGYRRSSYSSPAERKPASGQSARRRANYFPKPSNT